MVVEFGNAHFADIAVLGTSGFYRVAGSALVFLFVHHAVVMPFVLLCEFLRRLFCNLPGRYRASFIVDPETDAGHYIGSNNAGVRHESVRHMLEYSGVRVADKPTSGTRYPPTAIR